MGRKEGSPVVAVAWQWRLSEGERYVSSLEGNRKGRRGVADAVAAEGWGVHRPISHRTGQPQGMRPQTKR